MRLVQVRDPALGPRVGLVQDDGGVYDLTRASPRAAASMLSLLDAAADLPIRKLVEELASQLDGPTWRYQELDRAPGGGAHLTVPIHAPEVWAAGVTYERSRDARQDESVGFSRLYSKVYEADRPELFLKTSNMLRVVGPHQPIGIRSDSTWTVPEPELALVIGPRGDLVGYTIGNDVTARDVEAANPLYLPQAKMFRGCCAIGPVLLVTEESVDPYQWTITLRAVRDGGPVYQGEIPVSKMRRRIDVLLRYLLMDNELLSGTVLLTGTGIVPPDDFTLLHGDVVTISIGPLGSLTNPASKLEDIADARG